MSDIERPGEGDRTAARATDVAAPSRAWTIVWRVFLGISPHPIVRVMRRFSDVGTVGELAILGRRTGRERRMLLGLIEVDGRRYVGHPNGLRAQWTRNLDAAGRAELVGRDGSRTAVVASKLQRGAERDAVIRQTGHAKPFPAGLLYRRSRRHLDASGEFFRLDPVVASDEVTGPGGAS
jgi:hypothetical protein